MDHVLDPFQPDERQRLDGLLEAAADAVEEWARHGTSKAANRFNMFELRPADETLLAAARRGRRAAGRGRRPPDEDGLAEGPPARGSRVTAGPAMRGKRGRDRAACAASSARLVGRVAAAPAGASRDLSALPPLLAATGTFADLRTAVAPTAPRRPSAARGRAARRPPDRPPRRAELRPARREDVPRGDPGRGRPAASGSPGSPATPRSATASPRSSAAWLGDPAAVVVLEPRTALAYERSELVADETAARVAALSAWRSGGARILVASVQALLQHTIAPGRPAGRAASRCAIGGRLRPEALLRELLGLGYTPAAEVAGRGEFARRGGIVDVFPPSAALPVRIEFFGDEIDSLRAFDPTDQRTVGPLDGGGPAARVGVPRAARGSGRAPRAARPGRREAARAPGRGPRPVRGRLRRTDGTPRRRRTDAPRRAP